MATNINLPTINIGSTSTAGTGGSTTPFYNPDIITPEQYFSGPVDFYTQTLGTGVGVTTPTDEQDKEEEDTSPNIFKPIGGGDNEYQSALSYTLSSAGQSGQRPSYDVTNYGVADVNSDVINSISGGKDLSKSWEQGFFDKMSDMISVAGNVFEQQSNKLKDASLTEMLSGVSTTGPFGTRPRATMVPGAIGAMPGVSMFAGLAAGFGALNMAQQAQNAAAFKATSAGAIMDVNGMMVSRAPGSLDYVGNLGSYSSNQIAGLEAISKGFVPGTLKAEVFNKTTGTWSYATGTKSMLDSDTMKSIGGTYDPTTGSFVNAFGQTSAMGTEKAAKATVGAFNSKYGSDLSWGTISQVRSQLETDFFGNVKPGTPTFEDLLTEAAIKDSMERTGLTREQLDKVRDGDFIVRSGSYDRQGKFTPGTSEGTNTKGYSTFSDFRGSSEEEEDAPDTGSSSRGDTGRDSASDDAADDEAGDTGIGGGGFDSDEPGDFKRGGRVGYAPGGEAGFAQRPEFVGGNQTQPDDVSVADDQPRDVQEGTFVINAAAADFAGRDDIEKMIRQAYKKVGDTGQSGVTQEVAINVSKGEVMIPPHIAKVIGYDRLNKINNRGKKEIARRQEAAGGGFIDRKKFAAGDRVTLYRGEPLDPSKVVATDYGYGKEDVGKFHTPDVKKAGRFAAGAGKGNQVIKSRKVTIDELFDGVEEAWKTQAKKKTEYFAKLPKSELNKNLRFVRELKRAYLAGERSLDSMAMFLQEQVFHDDKSRINFIETFKNDPKSAGKLAGRALTKIATKATPPLAILGVAAEVFTPSDLGKSTLYDDSFMDYQFTPKE